MFAQIFGLAEGGREASRRPRSARSGRGQRAQELGIKAFDFKRVREGAAASGETFKSDVMMRNL